MPLSPRTRRGLVVVPGVRAAPGRSTTFGPARSRAAVAPGIAADAAPSDDEENELTFVHMKSETFKRIHYELMRYCRGEIDGLSVAYRRSARRGKDHVDQAADSGSDARQRRIDSPSAILHGPTIIDASAMSSDSDDKEIERSAGKGASASPDHHGALPQPVLRDLRRVAYRRRGGPQRLRRRREELLGLRAHLDLPRARA